MQPRLIAADTETTGDKDTDRVCEIAWSVLDENLQVIETVHSLIDPEMHISAAASGVHGIVDADVTDSPTIDEFFSIVRPNEFKDCDVVFIAHNSKFDRRYFEPYAPRIVADICTLRLAKRYLTEAENHKLTTLKYQFNLDLGNSHRADGDVATLVSLLRLLVERSGKTLQELAEISPQPLFLEKLAFGKHKDEPIREVPRSYWNWVLKQADMDSDVLFTGRQIMAGLA